MRIKSTALVVRLVAMSVLVAMSLVPRTATAQSQDCHYCDEFQDFPGGFLKHCFPGDEAGDPSNRAYDAHADTVRGACSYWHPPCEVIEQEDEDLLVEDLITLARSLKRLSEKAILRRLREYDGLVKYDRDRRALQVVSCNDNLVVIHVPIGSTPRR